jgi:glucose uptake protein GlcU
VFTARWTFPTLLKGTTYVFADLLSKKHLIVWALLAGALWAVANTLTVFAVRDVGLAVAFPLWNMSSLVGLIWGRVLFRELKGATSGNIVKVIAGAVAIVLAAVMLGYSTIQRSATGSLVAHHALSGIVAAIGASLIWGTMYIPYRKAYLSGMNPLSFVTAFTVGELVTALTLVLTLDGGIHSSVFHPAQIKGVMFWLFLGGFVWVIGDLFQQFAAKYLGIGRGIPLSNTNQLWGLAWGALVFGELVAADQAQRLLVIAGSVLMILGALAISTAVASNREFRSMTEAVQRECDRYGLDFDLAMAAQDGVEMDDRRQPRRWWDYAIVVLATGVFIALARWAVVPPLAMKESWIVVLGAVLFLSLAVGTWSLWRRTSFS